MFIQILNIILLKSTEFKIQNEDLKCKEFLYGFRLRNGKAKEKTRTFIRLREKGKKMLLIKILCKQIKKQNVTENN